MHRTGNYYVTVIEDVTSSRIVATATLFTEYKFIHEAAIVSVKYFQKLNTILTITQSIDNIYCFQ
jgi:hypothetical protein